MIVDSSAIVAILKNEPIAAECARILDGSASPRMCAAVYSEAGIVLDAMPIPGLGLRFDALLADAQIVIEPLTVEQARIARGAYRKYGKGTGHPARLNFGDCFSYALAIDKNEPLLFVGEDFRHTDVRCAL